jgi:hypothetical protein
VYLFRFGGLDEDLYHNYTASFGPRVFAHTLGGSVFKAATLATSSEKSTKKTAKDTRTNRNDQKTAGPHLVLLDMMEIFCLKLKKSYFF